MTDDLRQYRLLLVSHHVLNQTTLPRPSDGVDVTANVELATSVVDWAYAEGHGVYQLPVPGYYFDEASSSVVDRPEQREADRSALAFVASQLQVYVANGYTVVGIVLLEDDSTDPREHAWVADLLAALAEVGIDDLPLWQASRTAPFDPSDISATHPLALGAAS